VLRQLFPDMVRPAAAGTAPKRPAVSLPLQAQQLAAGGKPAAGAARPLKPGRVVVSPVLSSAAGAVALMPGLKAIPSSAEAQMSALMEMMRSPEEVVRNSELVTVPHALQAKLAKIASAAMGGAKTVLPADVQAELERYLRSVAGRGHGKDILVPAGSTGMVFGPQVQALLGKAAAATAAGGGVGGGAK
jgi:hypothetical protein